MCNFNILSMDPKSRKDLFLAVVCMTYFISEVLLLQIMSYNFLTRKKIFMLQNSLLVGRYIGELANGSSSDTETY